MILTTSPPNKPDRLGTMALNLEEAARQASRNASPLDMTPSFGSRSGSSNDFKHGFQGMAYDDVAGLNPQRERWYSPTMQRWTTTDPIGYLEDDDNIYRFVGNDPVNHLDPSGLTWWRRNIGAIPVVGYIDRKLNFVEAVIDHQITPNADTGPIVKSDPLSAGALSSRAGQVAPGTGVDTTFNGIYPASTDRGVAVNDCGKAASKQFRYMYISGILVTVSVAGVIAIGTNFGRLGTVIQNPSQRITGFTPYSANRAAMRGVRTIDIQQAVAAPVAVFRQSGGNTLYISDQAAVVLNPRGIVVTTYGRADFDSTILGILQAARSVP